MGRVSTHGEGAYRVNNPIWSQLLQDVMPGRVAKPRLSGLTMVIDTGTPPTMVRDILQLSALHIDFWKFGFGSAAVCPPECIANKVAMCQEYGVLAYPGGTSMEIAVTQGVWKEYMEALWEGGVRVVEVSDGTIDLSAKQRRELIRTARKKGFTVLSEIGKKRRGVYFPPERMAQLIQTDLNSGAHYVIVEGREGGKEVGVFDAQGCVRGDMVRKLVELLGPLATRLIWEAPLTEQQVYYIQEFGHKVNLGNIKPLDVVSLESLRRGLRSDTLRSALGIMEDEVLLAVPDESGNDEHAREPNVIQFGLTKPTLWTDGGEPAPSTKWRNDRKDQRPH
ncbi:phosphosulfolactate synthase [Alicyclobacillus pomorum]